MSMTDVEMTDEEMEAAIAKGLREVKRLAAGGAMTQSAWTPPSASQPKQAAEKPPAIATPPANQELVGYAKQVEHELLALGTGHADEALLAKLAAGEVTTALQIQDLQDRLARRMMVLIDNPKSMLAISHVLRDVNVVLSAMTKRVSGTLTTASTLRAQRRFNETYRREG
jgi:ABC-type uncharacterized transport system substrate-binding protein